MNSISSSPSHEISSSLIPPQILSGNPERDRPQFALSVQRKSGQPLWVADPRASRALIALMDMQAVLGGAASHFGGPSALAELMSASFALMFAEGQKKGQPWYELFHFVNDAGHCENGLYALRANYEQAGVNVEALKGFRSLQSNLTGHGEAHLFPKGVYLSNGPLGSAFPQAQGLCVADRLLGRERTTVAVISDGACMEGEAKEALASVPGLAAKGKMAPFVLIISDNNTKLSGRIDDEAFSMEPSFASLASLGWRVLKLDEAHDLTSCVHTLEEALEWARKDPSRPVAIHAKTVKGYGVEKTAQSSTGGHGFPLKHPKELRAFISEIYQAKDWPEPIEAWLQELEGGQDGQDGQDAELMSSDSRGPNAEPAAKPTPSTGPSIWGVEPREKIQVGVAKALINKKSQGLPLFSVSADLAGSTGVAGFQKKFPDSSIDVGVAEANMISLAAGLSKEGFIPVVDTFAQFGVTKGALPLTMAALSQAPVIAIFSHVGFQDAADGASHQALTYFAKTCALPHTEVYALTCSEEAEALVSQAIDRFAEARKQGKTPPHFIFFLGRENFPRHYSTSGSDRSSLGSASESSSQATSGAPSTARPYRLGSGHIVADNSSQGFQKSVTLVGVGSMLLQCLVAQEQLAARGIGSVVVNPSVIHKPDIALLKECLEKTAGHILTVEEHQKVGGAGALIAQALLLAGVNCQMKSLAVEGEFGRSAYSAQELYDHHNLGAEAIVQTSAEILNATSL